MKKKHRELLASIERAQGITIPRVNKRLMGKYHLLKQYVKSRGITVEVVAASILEQGIDRFLVNPDLTKYVNLFGGDR